MGDQGAGVMAASSPGTAASDTLTTHTTLEKNASVPVQTKTAQIVAGLFSGVVIAGAFNPWDRYV